MKSNETVHIETLSSIVDRLDTASTKLDTSSVVDEPTEMLLQLIVDKFRKDPDKFYKATEVFIKTILE